MQRPPRTILRIPFATTSTCFERVFETLRADGIDEDELRTRSQAFSSFARSKTALPLPDAELFWTTGHTRLAPSRAHRADAPEIDIPDMTTAPEAAGKLSQPALATDNAGGIVHMGSLHITHPGSGAQDAAFILTSLRNAKQLHPHLYQTALAYLVPIAPTPLVGIARAFENCGVFIGIPDDVVVQAPIQILWSYPQALGSAVFPRIVISAGRRSRATIIERHVGSGDAVVSGLIELAAQEKANLEYIVLQQTGGAAHMHFVRTLHCQSNAFVRWYGAEVQTVRSQTRVETRLTGKFARCDISALGLQSSLQKSRLTIRTLHKNEGTTSNTIVRYAFGFKSAIRFIHDLQFHSDARVCRSRLDIATLLLARSARVDILPHRSAQCHEIAHSERISTGSLDEETLLYITSRGISPQEAKRMITLAFFEPAITPFPNEIIRDEIRSALDEDIDQAIEHPQR